jgi:predicted transcriptional regulator
VNVAKRDELDDGKNRHYVTFRANDPLKSRLDALTRRERRSRSAVVRRLVIEALKQRPTEN